ncbi:MAG: hypothetical protein COB04_11510 [Gammaproteobacteria bacterium]|nr:MAG: hypothetical protein COB04_11510 [Gammaproteobacteria bacterium]
MIKNILWVGVLLSLSTLVSAARLSGVTSEEQVTSEQGQVLVLNGMGVREKFWVDVYVGSLYLGEKTARVETILGAGKAWRIRMDFVHDEVEQNKLIEAWRDGFVNNQDDPTLKAINARMEQFYGFFDSTVLAKEYYVLEYVPAKGTRITRNNKLLGVIPGEEFQVALLEIWLGKVPADKGLKRGMLGVQ